MARLRRDTRCHAHHARPSGTSSPLQRRIPTPVRADPGGGRGDGPDGLTPGRRAARARPGLPRPGRRAPDRPPPSRAAARGRPAAAGAGRADAGRRAPGGGAGRRPVPRRGPPRGAGGTAPRRPPPLPAPGTAPGTARPPPRAPARRAAPRPRRRHRPRDGRHEAGRRPGRHDRRPPRPLRRATARPGASASAPPSRRAASGPSGRSARGCGGTSAASRRTSPAARHGHGSRPTARDLRKEPRSSGVASPPAFARAPEGNGRAGRLVRTPEEGPSWARSLATVGEPRRALPASRAACDATRLVGRHGPRPPAAVSRERLSPAAPAAQAPARCPTNRGRYRPPVRDREALPDRRADALRLAADRPRGGPPRAQAAPRRPAAGRRRAGGAGRPGGGAERRDARRVRRPAGRAHGRAAQPLGPVPGAEGARPGAEEKTLQAAEQDREDVAEARAAWRAELAGVDPARLVFIDETGIDTRMTRPYARAARGSAPWARCPGGGGSG